MKLLTIDTSRNLCAAMLKNNAQEFTKLDYIERGHAERLIPQISELQTIAKWQFNELKAIVVNTGPGSFTGVRIGVSAARALSLAMNIPAIGVSIFSALAFIAKNRYSDKNIAILLPAYADHYSCFILEAFEPMQNILQIYRSCILSYNEITEKYNNWILVSTSKISNSTYVPEDIELLQAFDTIARLYFSNLLNIAPVPIYMNSY